MKKAIVLALLLLGGSAQAAQPQALLIILFGDKLSTEKFQLGINADLTFSSLTGTSDASTRMSWAFGAYGEVNLGTHWRLQPELTVKTPAGASNITAGTVGNPFQPTGDPPIDDAIANGTVTRTANYLTLPLVLKYVAGPLAIGAGGQLGYLTGADDELISEVDQGALRLKQSVKDSLNNWDAGLIGSLDFAFKPEKRMRSLRLNVKFYYGLTDTLKENPGDPLRNWILYVGLDIPVGGSDAAEDVGN
jgi:hypothetical protein